MSRGPWWPAQQLLTSVRGVAMGSRPRENAITGTVRWLALGAALPSAKGVPTWLLGLVMAGCTPFLPGDDIREDSETLAQRPDMEEVGIESLPGESMLAGRRPWDCLDDLDSPGEASVRPGTRNDLVTLRVRYHDFVTQMPLGEDFEVRVCTTADVNCTTPLVDFQPLPATGQFAALVPWGSALYLELRGPGAVPQITLVDTLVYDDLELYSHLSLPLDAFQQFGLALGVELDPEASLIGLIARDCQGREVGGVSFELSVPGNAVPYIVNNGIPTTEAESTRADGTFGFANVPPGLSRITARNDEGRVIDEQSLLLRAGELTYVTTRPVIYSAEEMCGLNGSPVIPGTRAALGQLAPCDLL